MAIPVAVPTKPFAHLHDTEGVPLDSMRPLLGQGSEIAMGNVTTATDQLAAAVGINSFVPVTPATNDRVIVRLRGGTLEWSLSVDDFVLITAASEGATLTAAGSGYTARELRPTGSSQTLLIGRTSANGVLVQRGTWAPGAGAVVLELHVVSYGSGVLRRRISPLQDHATRQVILHPPQRTQASRADE